MAFIHPILNRQTYPKSPDVISKAIMMAGLSDPDLRDPRYLMSLLTRLKRVIPRLDSHISTRRSLIAGADWTIEPQSDAFAEAAAAAEFRLGRFIKKYFKPFINADLFGVSVAPIIWRPSDVGLIPDLGRTISPTEIEPDPDALDGIVFLKNADTLNLKFYRVPINPAERHTFITRVADFEEPGGLLVKLAFSGFLLNASTQEWYAFIQMLKGIIQGTHESGSTEDEIEAGKKGVETAAEYNYVFTSERIKYIFNKVADSNASSSFDDFQSKIEEDAEIVITGATSLANDRERNAATVQERAQETIAKEGRQEFAEIINDQLLRYDYYLNGSRDGLDHEPPYRFVFKQNLPQDRESNSRIIETLTNIGYPVSLKDIEAKTGIKAAKDGDDILTPPARSGFGL